MLGGAAIVGPSMGAHVKCDLDLALSSARAAADKEAQGGSSSGGGGGAGGGAGDGGDIVEVVVTLNNVLKRRSIAKKLVKFRRRATVLLLQLECVTEDADLVGGGGPTEKRVAFALPVTVGAFKDVLDAALARHNRRSAILAASGASGGGAATAGTRASSLTNNRGSSGGGGGGGGPDGSSDGGADGDEYLPVALPADLVTSATLARGDPSNHAGLVESFALTVVVEFGQLCSDSGQCLW